MKKRNIIAILACLAAVLMVFAACGNNGDDGESTNPTVVDANGNVYQAVTEVVTDADGEPVTDAEGNTQVITVTKPVETTAADGDEAVNATTVGGTTVEGTTTYEDVTFPEGEEIEVEVDKNGRPEDCKMDKILNASAANKAFYINCTVVTNQNLGIVETGVPMKVYVKDSKFAFEMTYGLMQMRMAYAGDNLHVIFPSAKAYYSVAAGSEGDMMEESLDIWDSIGSTTMDYVGTTNVKLKGVEYVCETYSDSTNTNKYYFNSKDELKRIEMIASDGTTTILKVTECSAKVDDDIFSVPKGYTKLTEEALAGLAGSWGLTA